ncbi:hypothetical protein CAPTEDRAFT_204245, partial [Capitella teleta]
MRQKRKSNPRSVYVYKEDKDYEVIFKALEKKVRPSNEEISASSKYFYLRQGNASLFDFFKQATETVEAMKIEEKAKNKTLRNLLLNGSASREIYRECLKERVDHLTSNRVMEIATNIEARNLMADDLSDMASQTLSQNALSRESSTLVNKINHHPKAPHLRPLWFSERHDSSIHLVEAEVDSGAGCNTFPLFLYRTIFGAAPLKPPSVLIKAFGDQPVRNLGCKVLFLHT